MNKQAKQGSFRTITWDNAPSVLSAQECAVLCQSSIHFITASIRKKKLTAHKVRLTKRVVYKVNFEDLQYFFNRCVKDNKRVNRGKLRANKRVSVISRGYRLLWKPEHPRADFNGYVPEHVVLMEKHLRRKIKKGQDVHHINGDKLDNRIENLKLYKTRGEHLRDAHGKQHKARIKLTRILSAGDKATDALTPEEKAEIFDMLVK